MAFHIPTVLTVALVGSCGVFLFQVFATSIWAKMPPKGLRLPPGPRGLLILGNTLQVGRYPRTQMEKWADQYGELFRIQLGWHPWVFLNSREAVKEVFDKQSAASSARIPMPVASDVVSGGYRVLMMGYTPKWRKLRALIHKILTPKSSDTFKPSQEFEAKQVLHDILTDNKCCDEFYMHVRRYTTSVVMTFTYGKRVPTWNCEDILEVYGVMKNLSESTKPGNFIADLIPPLSKLPVWLQLWRNRALQYHERQKYIWMKHWNSLNRQIEEKKAPDCFVKNFRESADLKKEGISDIQAAFVAGTMIEAGSETTSSSLNNCIKFLAANPRVQKRAHEELSRVVGDARSPTFDDETSLPYIRAIVKEILRMCPVARLGIPHYTTAPVVYKDYYIPAGTVLSVNQYAIHFDPETFHNPLEFNPDRYLDFPHKAGYYAAAGDPYQRDHYAFGVGRRICPGMHLAENSIFIVIAKILWAFEIRAPIGQDMKEEHLDTSDEAYEPGMMVIPKRYKICFISRNEKREQVLEEEWNLAKRDGFYLGDRKVNEEGMVV